MKSSVLRRKKRSGNNPHFARMCNSSCFLLTRMVFLCTGAYRQQAKYKKMMSDKDCEKIATESKETWLKTRKVKNENNTMKVHEHLAHKKLYHMHKNLYMCKILYNSRCMLFF